MKGKRPVMISVFGWLEVIIGGVGSLWLVWEWIYAGFVYYWMFALIYWTFLLLPTPFVLIAGIGLLRMKFWGIAINYLSFIIMAFFSFQGLGFASKLFPCLVVAGLILNLILTNRLQRVSHAEGDEPSEQTLTMIVREALLAITVVFIGYWLLYFVTYFFLGRTDLIRNKVTNTIMPSSAYNEFDFRLSSFVSLPSYLIIRFIIWVVRTLRKRQIKNN
jgi:hypothetical protein